VDGHRVEFGFAANLAADIFRQMFNIKKNKNKIKTNKFKTHVAAH